MVNGLAALASAAMPAAGCAARQGPVPTAAAVEHGSSATTADMRVEAIDVALPAGHVRADVYRPAMAGNRPLVVVAHGFSRSRKNMAGWGRHLAAEGFLTVVPSLPAWSDHERNGRAVRELIGWWLANRGAEVDASRVAVVGFSAGGLATLLAAAADPRVALWIGLDPVDRGGKGAAAAPSLRARALVLRAEPSSCNAHGNAAGIVHALGDNVEVVSIAGATHTDPEWPTDWKARLVCGRDDEARRRRFVDGVTLALRGM